MRASRGEEIIVEEAKLLPYVTRVFAITDTVHEGLFRFTTSIASCRGGDVSMVEQRESWDRIMTRKPNKELVLLGYLQFPNPSPSIMVSSNDGWLHAGEEPRVGTFSGVNAIFLLTPNESIFDVGIEVCSVIVDGVSNWLRESSVDSLSVLAVES